MAPTVTLYGNYINGKYKSNDSGTAGRNRITYKLSYVIMSQEKLQHRTKKTQLIHL